jgi:hypothetical protein
MISKPLKLQFIKKNKSLPELDKLAGTCNKNYPKSMLADYELD